MYLEQLFLKKVREIGLCFWCRSVQKRFLVWCWASWMIVSKILWKKRLDLQTSFSNDWWIYRKWLTVVWALKIYIPCWWCDNTLHYQSAYCREK